MARQQDQDERDPIVAAIERVLHVERDGVQQWQRSQEQAKQLMNQARAQAAVIAGRADACIARLYGNYLQKVDDDIKNLAQSNLLAVERDQGYDRARLVEAIRRVAAKLTDGP